MALRFTDDESLTAEMRIQLKREFVWITDLPLLQSIV